MTPFAFNRGSNRIRCKPIAVEDKAENGAAIDEGILCSVIAPFWTSFRMNSLKKKEIRLFSSRPEVRNRIDGQVFQATLKGKPDQETTSSNGGDIALTHTLASQGTM